MTLEKAKRAIEALKQRASNPEAAHALEDTLHQAVLVAISKGHPQSRELATEAFKSVDIKFERGYGPG